MNRITRLMLLPISALLLAVFATSVSAQTYTYPLNQQSPTSFSTGGSPDATRGWRFQVNAANIVVGRLGVFSPTSSTAGQTLTLWSVSTQQKLAEVMTSAGAGWCWEDLQTPVALTQGEQYIVTHYCTVSGGYYFQCNVASSWRPTGDIQFLDMRYANNTPTPVYPTSVLTNDCQYGVPDIGYVADSVAVERASQAIANGATDSPAGITTASATTVDYTLNNLGGTPLTVNSISVTNPMNVTATVSSSPTTVAANGSETVSVDIQASSGGTWSFDLEIDTNGTPSLYTVSVDGNVGPEIDILDTMGSLGMAAGGRAITLTDEYRDVEREVEITIENTGSSDLTVSNVSVAVTQGTFGSEPAITMGSSIGTIAPGGSEIVRVALTPDSGDYSFTITVTSDDADEATSVVQVGGRALAKPETVLLYDGELLDLQTPIMFPSRVGGTPFQVEIGVRNDGDAPLVFDSMTPFEVVLGPTTVAFTSTADIMIEFVDPGDGTIGPGETEMVRATATPTTLGEFEVTVTLRTNDPEQPTVSYTFEGVLMPIPVSGSDCSMGGDGSQDWSTLAFVLSLAIIGLVRRRRVA